MNVRTIKDITKPNGKIIKKGTIYQVTNGKGKELIAAGWVEETKMISPNELFEKMLVGQRKQEQEEVEEQQEEPKETKAKKTKK